MKCVLIIMLIAGSVLAGGVKIDKAMIEQHKNRKAAKAAIVSSEMANSPSTLAADINALKSSDASNALKSILLRLAGISTANLEAGKVANTKKSKKHR